MAGASMKQIKTRMKSVENTRQITKAMELVASSKLRRAKERAENSRPYHQVLAEAISGIQAGAADAPSPFLTARPVKKTCYVVIGGDRGLAGGYNANLFRTFRTLTDGTDFCVLPVGKKTLEFFRRQNCELLTAYYGLTAAVGAGECAQMARLLCDGFEAGQFDAVTVVYTKFRSVLSQIPVSETLLPFIPQQTGKNAMSCAIVEGDEQELIARIIPLYVSGILYADLCEAAASEHAARRTAMNSANKNADEIIETLALKYNRARQAVITQEITEIVSGAEAL